MKKVILYEPSIGSDNFGDQIIVDSVKYALSGYLSDAFTIEMSTHNPLSWRYLRYIHRTPVTQKIVCGSNLIVGKLNSLIHMRQWALSASTIRQAGPCVFIGVGSQQYNQKINAYTRSAYQYLFNKDYLHSVRDSYTEQALKSIGIHNVVNTACPTMWSLTEEKCASIPTSKASTVVFTLTDYKQDKNRDEKLISCLKRNYKNVWFWVQGNGDAAYFQTLQRTDGIKLLKPNLESYNDFLLNQDTDFVGTRLHGGMRAMQMGRRTIIIAIDNRATELQKDFGIPVIQESDIDQLDDMICGKWETRIELPTDNIRAFMEQFTY